MGERHREALYISIIYTYSINLWREGCWVGRAVEEVGGGVIRQGAVGAGGRGIFFRVDSVLVGLEFGAVVGA